MAQSFYAAPDAICRNVTGAPTAKIYKSTRVEDTVLGEYVTVGDFSRLGGCRLDEHVALQRNNMLYGVTMGRYSYTGPDHAPPGTPTSARSAPSPGTCPSAERTTITPA